jgi:hypothetical protein
MLPCIAGTNRTNFANLFKDMPNQPFLCFRDVLICGVSQ